VLQSETHRIRLRGPWRFRVLSEQPARSGRVALPCDWSTSLGADFRGRVAYTRRFQRPTGLSPGQRVELVLDGVDAFGSVSLNGSGLLEIPPGGAPARVDIAPLLTDRNELVVEVELPSADEAVVRPPGREHSPGGLYGEVRLEIHDA
jgi:beta-galactosidase/beta-glucuronidase